MAELPSPVPDVVPLRSGDAQTDGDLAIREVFPELDLYHSFKHVATVTGVTTGVKR